MSFEIQADNIIQTLWDSLRPESPGYERRRDPETGEYATTEPGLLVTLDLRLSHISLSTDEYHRSALVHTVLTANTSVFQARCPKFTKWDQVALGDFFNYSNHDSCWRTDGMRGLQHLFSEWTAEMNEEMAGHGFSHLTPREFDQFCTMGWLSHKPWEFVTVGHRKIPTEHHRRELVSLERLSPGDQR